ncbi:MAG: hypothetical protein CMA31_05735 [Euryarchaeota archaeon]|nr:hypothetical protein [Euryarchaeota archaeon]|tara:strand:+ start:4780 stop:5325 length:546 start_codon:yes stop_codon:yes gene_type:complete
MSENRIIVLSGPPGSGKAAVGHILEEMGWKILSLGDVVRSEVASRNLEPTPSNIGYVAQDMRDQFGPAIVMERLLHDIEEALEHNHVVIDGLRQIEELERLQSSQPRMIVIAVEAPESDRRERINSRLRSDDGNFDEREAREWGWGLEMVMQLADLTIKNDQTEGDFRASIFNSLHSIGVE